MREREVRNEKRTVTEPTAEGRGGKHTQKQQGDLMVGSPGCCRRLNCGKGTTIRLLFYSTLGDTRTKMPKIFMQSRQPVIAAGSRWYCFDR